mgnify:CR=1 FL=1
MGAAKVGTRAPDFSLTDMQGLRRPLREWLGQGQIVVAFFKVSCPTCQYTFPFLERLHQKLPGKLVGISQDGKRATEGFNRDYGVGFPVLLDPAEEDYPVSNAYGITHVPTLFLIEPDGRVALTSAGFVKGDLEEIARRLGPVPLFHRDERVEAFRAG